MTLTVAEHYSITRDGVIMDKADKDEMIFELETHSKELDNALTIFTKAVENNDRNVNWSDWNDKYEQLTRTREKWATRLDNFSRPT